MLSVAGALAFSGCTSGATPSAGSARDRAAEYVRAVGAHDGSRLCAMFSAPLRRRFEIPIRNQKPDCAKTVTALIGFVEDAGTPVWKGVRFARVEEVAVRDGRATVSFGALHRIAEYDARLHREVEHPVRLEDRLDLVWQDGEWRLDRAGATLAASGAAVDKPAPARTDSPEHVVRDYLLGISGGPVDVCPIVPATFGCEQRRSRWWSDDPSPLWQSAAIRRLSVRVDGDSAVVDAAVQVADVQGAPGHERLLARPMRADMHVRRVRGRWTIQPSDAISRHALGLPPEPASARPSGSPLALPAGVHPRTVIAGRGDDALLFFTRGQSLALRAAVVHGTSLSSSSHVVAQQQITGAVQLAADPSSGGAVAAWVETGATIMVRRIGRSGAPAGPAHAVGVISAGADEKGAEVSPYLSALSASRDGHVLVGWSVTAMSSRPRLDGIVVDPTLKHASAQCMLADDPGYGLALTPSPSGWLTAVLLADQPDPTQETAPQISMGGVPVRRHRSSRGRGWTGIEQAGPLGPPALGSTAKGALMAYAHGDRPATVLAQPLTLNGEPIGQPVELSATPTAPAASVRPQVLVRGSGYRVAWSTPSDRRSAGALTYVDVDARGRTRGAPVTISLRAREMASMPIAHVLMRSSTTLAADGRRRTATTILTLP
jgi:hypothetical protein